MKNYKALDAHRFFIAGWVRTIYLLKTDEETYVFKAQVTPSYRVTEDPHNAWLCTNGHGDVSAAHCDCMAGLVKKKKTPQPQQFKFQDYVLFLLYFVVCFVISDTIFYYKIKY